MNDKRDSFKIGMEIIPAYECGDEHPEGRIDVSGQVRNKGLEFSHSLVIDRRRVNPLVEKLKNAVLERILR